MTFQTEKNAIYINLANTVIFSIKSFAQKCSNVLIESWINFPNQVAIQFNETIDGAMYAPQCIGSNLWWQQRKRQWKEVNYTACAKWYEKTIHRKSYRKILEKKREEHKR